MLYEVITLSVSACNCRRAGILMHRLFIPILLARNRILQRLTMSISSCELSIVPIHIQIVIGPFVIESGRPEGSQQVVEQRVHDRDGDVDASYNFV